MDVKNLEPYAIIGFDGSVLKGLKIHPDGRHVVYPMGNKVCIQEWKTKMMSFLSGHSNSVSAIAISPKGTYIGSGQINHIGFKASAKLWDFKRKTMIGTHELHKVRVEALSFTSDERYMISLGGRDDGTVVIWDCVSGAATGTAAATKLTTGDAMTVAPLLLRHNSFVTAGDANLRIWNIRSDSKSLDVVDVSLGKLRRSVRCIAINKDDAFGYAGTTSGDLIKFSINFPTDPLADVVDCKPTLLGCQAKCGPWRKGRRPESVCYAQGVEAIIIMSDGCLVVGAGDGSVELLDEINWVGDFPKSKVAEPNKPTFRALKSTKLDGSITSLELLDSPAPAQRKLLAGTRRSEIYAINLQTFEPLLVLTCHTCAINDIAFPRGMSGVFASAGAGDVRVWCLRTAQELLRVVVPNFVCSSLLFAADGKSLVTAWNDGNIRAFTPLTGRLIYCIYNTHNKGTTALDMTTDGRTLVSGGCEGQVRVWDIRPESQTLKKVLKEHKSPVSAIQVSPSDTEAVSAGTDGSCIIWDLLSLSRRQVLYANTLFTCVRYSPLGGGCQLLTGGTDRRVAYWEAAEGHLARELEASKSGAINSLDISSDGDLFITGGNDQMVKLWQYQAGVYTHVGLGHAAAVTSVRFAPDGRHAVSACAAGGIFVWRVPEEYIEPSSSRSKARETVAESPKSLQQQLTLPLEEKPKRQPNKIPSAPVKVEKIEAIDTTRSSVHSCCPCRTQRSEKSDKSKKTPCRPPDNLPTRTTSKNSINRCGNGK